MTFHVFEGFLSFFLYLFIKGIFISEQSHIRLNLITPDYAQFPFELLLCVIFNIFLRAILVYFIRKVEIVTILD